MSRQRALQYVFLLAAAVVLSTPVATAVFAAAPMRASRRAFGRGPFWAGHLTAAAALAALGLAPAGAALALVASLVGSYAEVEEHNSSVFASASFAVLTALGVAAVAVGTWGALTKGSPVEVVRAQVADVAQQMAELNPKAQINVDAFVHQTPSYLAVGLILALAASLAWESRAAAVARLPSASGARERLLAFRAPDACVWIAIAATLGAFGLRGAYPAVESASMNALNVLMAVYFLQGLAVVAKTFEAYQVGTFWRGFWYVMIAIQLHVFVSLLGFADFWAEFRARLPKNRPFQMNDELE